MPLRKRNGNLVPLQVYWDRSCPLTLVHESGKEWFSKITIFSENKWSPLCHSTNRLRDQMMDKVTEAIINKLPRLISQRPLEWARTKPDHPAIVEDKVSWSYRDLAIAVEKTKHLLSELGIRPGDRVLVINENGRAFVALLFACSELGACIVSVNARLSASEIDNIQFHCQTRRTIYTVEVSSEAMSHAERHGG